MKAIFNPFVLRAKEQSSIFWLFVGGIFAVFALINFGQQSFTPITIVLHFLLSIVFGWQFGSRIGVLVGLLLTVMRLFVFGTIMSGLPQPNIRFFVTTTFITPVVAGFGSGWVGNRFRRIQQLSADLLGEQERLQQEITQREVLEQQLQQAVIVAQEASKTKSAFLANMSHELRTPLAAIIGYNEMSRERLDDESPIAGYLDKALLSARHLQGIINDVLDLSRIEAGRLVIVAEAFSLTDCITAVLDIIVIKANTKHLYVQYCIQPHTPEQMIGDTVHLQQILINLLDNAVKFTEVDGVTLTVAAKAQDSGHYQYHFTVQDTGPGIAAASQRHIFETFHQVNNTPAKQKGGAGLGLAICRYLVEAMSGHIWVESAPGEGATFHFTIQTPIVEKSPLIHTDGLVLHQLNQALQINLSDK